MSDDKTLADKCVEHGVGFADHDSGISEYDPPIPGDTPLTADEFVRDWRVAGALEQLVINRDWIFSVDHHGCCTVFTDKDEPNDIFESTGDDLCRNRIEACVATLDDDNE